MFDVDWSDPNRESVGDRRARKGRGKAQDRGIDASDSASASASVSVSASASASQSLNDIKGLDGDQAPKAGDPDQENSQNSGSIRSSVSSIEKQFGFFGGKNRTKGNSTPRKTKATPVAGSSLRTPTIEEQLQKKSPSLLSTKKRRADSPKRTSGTSACLFFSSPI